MSEVAPTGKRKRHPSIRKIELFFFFLGLVILAFLVHRYGLQDLLAHLAATGWTFLLIVTVWFVIYLLNTTSWRLVLGREGGGMSFLRLFRINVSGFALNDITPLLGIGGEPYKMSVLSETMGRGQSVSAVTLYRMIYTLAHLSFLFVGVVLTLTSLRLPAPLRQMLVLAGLVLLAIISILLVGHRKGFFVRIFARLQGLKFLRRLFERFSVRQESVERMDELITNAYRERKADFYGAVGLEFLSRWCMALEIYLILRSFGLEVNLPQAFFLYICYSILMNIFIVVPYTIGVREGGFYFAMQSLAFPAMVGVYLAIVMRIREFFWALIGLLFIGLGNLRRKRVT